MLVLIVAALLFNYTQIFSVSTSSSSENCEDSRENDIDRGYWVSDCYLVTESLMKCNDYWAIVADHRYGYSKSWIDDPEDLGKYFHLYDDYGDWSTPGAREAVDQFFSNKPESVLALMTGQAVVTKL